MNTEEFKKHRREYMREWNKQNPDKIKLTNEKRKEYLIVWRKQHYLKHAEEFRTFQRQYYAEHKKEILSKTPERVKAWAKANPDRMREISRANSRKRYARILDALGESFTIDQWLYLCIEYNNRCAYCYKQTKLEMDHVVPVSNGGLHQLSNIVPACRSCNNKKRTQSLLLFLYTNL